MKRPEKLHGIGTTGGCQVEGCYDRARRRNIRLGKLNLRVGLCDTHDACLYVLARKDEWRPSALVAS